MYFFQQLSTRSEILHCVKEKGKEKIIRTIAFTVGAAILLSGCPAEGTNRAAQPATSSPMAPLLVSPVPSKPLLPSQGEKPEGVVYCGGKLIQRTIEFQIKPKTDVKDQWDVQVRILETNAKTKQQTEKKERAMTAYSYYGKQKQPAHFQVAILMESRGELLVFKDGNKNWLEFGDYKYNQCN